MPTQNRIGFYQSSVMLQEVVHKSQFNSTNYLPRNPYQKNRRVRSESCGNKDVFVEASASEGRWF